MTEELNEITNMKREVLMFFVYEVLSPRPLFI